MKIDAFKSLLALKIDKLTGFSSMEGILTALVDI